MIVKCQDHIADGELQLPACTTAPLFAPAKCLKHYATSRKAVGSTPHEVIEYSSLYLSFQSHHGTDVCSASNINE
jgi:hypothetical protein